MRFLTAWCCALAFSSASAQTLDLLPLPQYPAGSITTVAQADQALRDAKRARLEQEKQFQVQRQLCFQKFLAENCLAPVREDNNSAVRRIRAVEVEARAFKRSDTAREAAAKRDQQRRAQAAAQAPRRQEERALTAAQQDKKIARNAASARQHEADAPLREQRAIDTARRTRERREARLKKEADENARAGERAERARAQEEKVADVLRRAREKEEKARQKAEKALPAGSQLPKRS